MTSAIYFDPSNALEFDEHVFPVGKYQLIADQLVSKGLISRSAFGKAKEASLEELLLVHTQEYLSRLERYTKEDPREAIPELEAPCHPQTLKAKLGMCGATIAATTFALKHSAAAINLGGGFHHAQAGRGAGFCFLNDIALSLRVAQRRGLLERALVVDTDVHQGDGTASIFKDDPNICVLDIHQQRIYPAKQPAEINIGLRNGCQDDEYIAELESGLERIRVGEFGRFELIHYVAGADPWKGDRLGGLKLTLEGFQRRDQAVIDLAQELRWPLVVTLAGGYAKDTKDTVLIHSQMVEAVIRGFGEIQPTG